MFVGNVASTTRFAFTLYDECAWCIEMFGECLTADSVQRSHEMAAFMKGNNGLHEQILHVLCLLEP